ncbi:MAG: cell division protein FtsZ [Saprospiraceae bacterium]|nr:cell division protein FtsZ [Saprospiraceae bacterium]
MSQRSIIKVIGVGGAGTNAVTHMFSQGIRGVDFAVCNTDQQSLELSGVPVKIQLGPLLTEGRGAGNNPEKGKLACEESTKELVQFLEKETRMLFVTAGMGGGTGTGAAPILARMARELGILTVGIVTMPFSFEGPRRGRHAAEGIEQLKQSVDALIVVSNDKLREVYGNLAMSSAFSHADNVLATAAKGIAEIITVPGYINVDFEDVNYVMKDSGVAIMGSAVAGGQDRSKKVIELALNSPLLEDNDIRGAKHILLNITTGRNPEITMDEVGEITEIIQRAAGHDTDLIWGSCVDDALDDQISVTLIATGFNAGNLEARQQATIRVSIDDETADMHSDNPSNARIFDVEHAGGANGFDEEEKYLDAGSPMVNWGASSSNTGSAKSQSGTGALRDQNSPLADSKTLHDAENVPAYERKKIRLDSVSASNELNGSRVRMVVDEDNRPEIREDSSFLHDNVD